MAVGASRSPALAYDVAKATADELAAIGFNWNLAPVLDIVDDVNSSMIGARAFGDEPGDVGRFGVAFMEGFRSAGMGSFAKNFPGNTISRKIGQIGFTFFGDVSRDELEASDMVPFRRAVTAGLDGIILNPAMWTGLQEDVTLRSLHVVHQIIRTQLGYDGPVICDFSDIPAYKTDIVQLPVLAAQAGCDLFLLRAEPETQIACIEAFYEAIRAGEISPSDISRSYGRIGQIKGRHLTWQTALQNARSETILPELVFRNQELAKKAYQHSTTIVRDNNSLIPIYQKLGGSDAILLLSPVVQPIYSSATADGKTMDPFECFGRALETRHPRIRHAPYTPHGLNETHRALIKVASLVIFVSSNAHSSDANTYSQTKIARSILQLCNGKPLLAMAVGDPYDLLMDRSCM